MPHRNPKINPETSSHPSILRRSPRFLSQEKSPENEDRNNKAKKPNSRKKKQNPRNVGTDSTEDFSLIKAHEGYLHSDRRRSLRSYSVVKTKDNESVAGSKNLKRSDNGRRQSLRVSITKPNFDKITKKTENESPDRLKGEITGSENPERSNNGLRQSPLFSVTKPYFDEIAIKTRTENPDESNISKEEGSKCSLKTGSNGSEELKGSSVISAVVPNGGGKKRRKREGGVERRSGACEEGCSFGGWTKEQETALQRAYFSVKPSPHFWKKVSKLVPQKSAQECFNRINSNLPTPNQPRPRSRRKTITNLSPLGHLTLSGSKLLEPIDPNFNDKRPKSRKQKSLPSHKTVRHLLRKHRLVDDQDYEADLFSVLEAASNPPTQLELPTTPDCILKSPVFSQEFHSRFPPDPHQTDLISPEVLKQVKNASLHEKYIDQLHCREAKRRTASGKPANHVVVQAGGVKGSGDVRAARTALVSDARDFVMQFQNINGNASSGFEDFDDDDEGDDDDDGGGDYEC